MVQGSHMSFTPEVQVFSGVKFKYIKIFHFGESLLKSRTMALLLLLLVILNPRLMVTDHEQ